MELKIQSGRLVDVLLDGPKKEEQMESERNNSKCWKAGIPCFGYNFSLAEYGDIKKQQKLGEEQLVLVLMQIC